MRFEGADAWDLALGLTIRVARHRGNMSQAELGERIGVSFQQVQKYERGTNRISFSMLVRLATALNCRASDLIRHVEGLGTDAGVLPSAPALAQPEAGALLDALAGITSPALRRGIVDLARTLARDEAAPASEVGPPASGRR